MYIIQVQNGWDIAHIYMYKVLNYQLLTLLQHV